MFMFMTNKELDARIDYACRCAVKSALETERNNRAISDKFKEANKTYISKIFNVKTPLEVLQERVESLEKENAERQARLDAWKRHCENKVKVTDVKFHCGTPVFYQDPIRNCELNTATIHQYVGRGWYIIEICSTGKLIKVPMSSLIRIQKEGAK